MISCQIIMTSVKLPFAALRGSANYGDASFLAGKILNADSHSKIIRPVVYRACKISSINQSTCRL